MDKYLKQSQKSKLWARRRNSTAELLLHGQLRYIEQDQRQTLKQHDRYKFRLDEELQDISRVSRDQKYVSQCPRKEKCRSFLRSEEDAQSHTIVGSVSPHTMCDNTSVTTLIRTGIGSTVPKSPRSREAAEDKWLDKVHEKSPTRNKQANENSLIPSDVEVHISGQDLLENDNDDTDNHRSPSLPTQEESLGNSVPWEELPQHQSQKRNSSIQSDSFRSNSTSVATTTASKGSCKFSIQNTGSKNTCKHFPCSMPLTYHALGFRRDDFKTWSYDSGDRVSRSKGKGNRRRNFQDHSDRETSKEAMEAFLVSDDFVINMHHKQRLDGDFEERQSKQKKQAREDVDLIDHKNLNGYPRPTYSPAVEASTAKNETEGCSPKPGRYRIESSHLLSSLPEPPKFVPKPADPLLERVRQGWPLAPRSSANKQAPRRTVEGRLRGLQALVKEMRAKHENARPVDWAINYGQRLPMRMLLNPVMKV